MPPLPEGICKACIGKGKNSKGGTCYPCRGTGRKLIQEEYGLIPREPIRPKNDRPGKAK